MFLSRVRHHNWSVSLGVACPHRETLGCIVLCSVPCYLCITDFGPYTEAFLRAISNKQRADT
jgi:acetone carboxylase gamma subunit